MAGTVLGTVGVASSEENITEHPTFIRSGGKHDKTQEPLVEKDRARLGVAGETRGAVSILNGALGKSSRWHLGRDAVRKIGSR